MRRISRGRHYETGDDGDYGRCSDVESLCCPVENVKVHPPLTGLSRLPRDVAVRTTAVAGQAMNAPGQSFQHRVMGRATGHCTSMFVAAEGQRMDVM